MKEIGTALWFWITEHATVLSTVVTGVATVAIAAFTIRLARVTRAQLAHNRVVERAHVFVKGVGASARLDPNGILLAWRVLVIVGNSGNTPTKNALIHVSNQIRTNELPNDFDFPDQWSPGVPREHKSFR